MSKVIYEKDGRIGRVTLNRPRCSMPSTMNCRPRLPIAWRARIPIPACMSSYCPVPAGPFVRGYDLTAYAQTTAT